MKSLEFLGQLRDLGVRVWRDGSQLRFSAPPGALTPELRTELAEYRDDILRILPNGDVGGRLLHGPISAASHGDELLMSPSQEAMWFLQQLDVNSAAYNRPKALQFEGPLDAESLRRATLEITRRHQSLRTCFPERDGSPSVVIHSPDSIKVTLTDLQSEPESTLDSEIQMRLVREANEPFDLISGPLFRAEILRLRQHRHVLLYTMHHIVSDGMSDEVFRSELFAIYRAFSSGLDSPLAMPAIQYTDYASWQRRLVTTESLDKGISYWRNRLDGSPSSLDFALERPHHSERARTGVPADFLLSGPLVNRLRTLAQAEGATLFMVLLAALKILLSRYTNQEDILVGAPVAGRSRPETKGLIGYFVNTLVLRTDLSGKPSFRTLLRRVRDTALGAFEHEDVPFNLLVEKLRLTHDRTRTPFFQTLFVLQDRTSFESQLSGISVSSIQVPKSTPIFDLELSMAEEADCITGTFLYRSELFDAETVDHLAQHFCNLLSSILANPDEDIGSLEILSAVERTRQLVEWNDTNTDFRTDSNICELIASQALQNPEAAAVAFEGETISYAKLETSSNLLAAVLREKGVGDESRVGVCLERSPGLIVAILAVLKAGGAYVPIDPHYPDERISFMIEDSGIEIVLTDRTLFAPTAALGVETVSLDHVLQAPCAQSSSPRVVIQSDALAYVIYTSGSTGTPKGVEVSHASLLNFVNAACEAYGLAHEDKVLQFASVSFDTAAEEIFPTLARGGTLVLRTDSMLDSVGAFLDACRSLEITVLDLPTAFWSELVEALDPDALRIPSQIRLVIIGGEAASRSSVDRWRRLVANRVRLVNTYGPTETTVVATMCDLTSSHDEDDAESTLVPIGRPISNVKAYVLNKDLGLVPAGVVGELFIGGAGVARGYFRRPELTSERFIANPYGAGRLYRTGDLVRYNRSGHLVYVGRSDHQVKIRGFRVELGEVEAILRRDELVRDVAVVARPNGTVRELVAYVVSNGTLSVNALREHMGDVAPAYMVPSRFVFIDKLPLTPNGKTDRNALPEPSRERPELEIEYVAPRTEMEESLVEIWKDTLRAERIGVFDDFFDVGGHSLLAVRLFARIDKTLGVRLPISAIFETPTIAGLAETIGSGAGSRNQLDEIKPKSSDKPAPVSFSQQRLWFLDQLEGNRAAPHISQAYKLEGHIDEGALRRAFSQLLKRHDSLRTNFHTVDGEPFQIVGEHKGFELSVLRIDSPDDLEQIIRDIERAPFDLVRDPMLRAVLIRVGNESSVLALALHHIATDHWSVGVLLRDLSEYYRAEIAGERANVDDLPIRYSEYAAWQREYMAGPRLEEHLAFWRDRLEEAPAAIELPTDRPRPVEQSYHGARLRTSIPDELAGSLDKLARTEGATRFMTLYAAFCTLLYRYSGQQDLVLGVPVAGRDRIETENLVGFFINNLVLRTKLSGKLTFRQLLRQCKSTILECLGHQELPFEKLVEELQPPRDRSRHPVFQVMFALQNAPGHPLKLPDIRVERITIDSTTSHFDLTMFVYESEAGLPVTIAYNTDLFDESTIKRLLGHYVELLNQLAYDPDVLIGRVPILSNDERQRVLTEWNDTASEYPSQCVSDLIDAKSRETPEAIAITTSSAKLSYEELEHRSNKLARCLRELGVDVGATVGVCLERTADLVVGLLGVLKAGGAYVPLDPSFPQERLKYIVADADIDVLLTQRDLAAPLSETVPHTLLVDEDELRINRYSEQSVSNSATADDLAYIIYTSGSTGQPKGVEISHGALVNFLWSMKDRPGLSKDDVLLSVTTPSFDIAALELFLPLVVGGRLVVATQDEVNDGNLLARALEASEVTVMQATPATWRMLLDAGWIGRKSLRMLCGGEALPTDLASELLTKGAELWNMYGPTETTIWSSVERIRANDAIISVGRPIANTSMFVLDDHLEPVLPGAPGTLYIGGHGLARGYHKRTDLTEERFVSNPFGDGRLYNTGDVVRYSSDGRLLYLGRSDQQVKIRGFRIELGEIESILRSVDSIDDAAVGKRLVENESELVAYLVVSRPITVSKLREIVGTQLPNYMIPSRYVFLDSLPLTPNGKVDRNALPEPDDSRPELESGYVQPTTDVEKRLVSIWETVLKVEPVGVHDNYFDLGGHSLLAVRLFSRVEKHMGIQLPIAAIFERPTIAQLSSLIENSDESSPERLRWILPINEEGNKTPLFCVHGFAGSVFFFRHVSAILGPDQPVYGLQSRSLDGEPISHSSVEEVARDYVAEILCVRPQGPYVLTAHCAGGKIAFEMAQQLRAAGHNVANLVLLDVVGPAAYKTVGARMRIGSRARRMLSSRGTLEFVKWAPEAISFGLYRRLFRKPLYRSHLLVGKWFAKRGRRLPHFIREHYTKQVFLALARDYQIREYDGPLTVVRASETQSKDIDTALGWKSIAKGDLRIVDLPVAHVNMVTDDVVAPELLAGILRKSISDSDNALAT